MRLSVSVAILIGMAAAAGLASVPRGGDAFAFVNGVPISRDQYEEYAAVLEGDGARSVPPWQVLQSLVNQRLALQEARERGYAVTDAEVATAMNEMTGAGVSVDMVGGASGRDAFRERIRVRLLFERVKAAITESVVVSDEDIRAYLDRAAALYQGVDWPDAKAEVEPAVRQELVDKVWSDWLAGKRFCSTITILVPVELPTASPTQTCP